MNQLTTTNWRLLWICSVTIANRILREQWHRKRSLGFWLTFPVVVMILNGLIFADRGEISLAEALQFAAPSALVGAAFFFNGLGGTLAVIVAEREQRTLRRLLIAPMPGAGYFLGICLAQGTIAVGQTLVVMLISRGLGAVMAGSWGLLVVLLGFCLISYVGAGLLLGTYLAQRADDVNTVIASFGIPLLILGGAFFPSSIFPPSLQAVANLNPIYHMVEAVTGVWADGLSWVDIADHGYWLLGVAVVLGLSGVFAYQQLLVREGRY